MQCGTVQHRSVLNTFSSQWYAAPHVAAFCHTSKSMQCAEPCTAVHHSTSPYGFVCNHAILCATLQSCVHCYLIYPAPCATICYCSLHMAIRKQLQMFIIIHGWYIWASMCLSCISFWICGPQWQFVALTLQPIVTVCVALSLWPKVTACVALTLWTAVIVCSTYTGTHRDITCVVTVHYDVSSSSSTYALPMTEQ